MRQLPDSARRAVHDARGDLRDVPRSGPMTSETNADDSWKAVPCSTPIPRGTLAGPSHARSAECGARRPPALVRLPSGPRRGRGDVRRAGWRRRHDRAERLARPSQHRPAAVARERRPRRSGRRATQRAQRVEKDVGTVTKLVRYTGALRYGAGRDEAVGGDDSAKPQVASFVLTTGLTWRDARRRSCRRGRDPQPRQSRDALPLGDHRRLTLGDPTPAGRTSP